MVASPRRFGEVVQAQGIEHVLAGLALLLVCALAGCWLCGCIAGCCAQRALGKTKKGEAQALSPDTLKTAELVASGQPVSPPKEGFGTGPRARRKLF